MARGKEFTDRLFGLRKPLQPAAPTISLGQQVALAGDEGLAQT